MKIFKETLKVMCVEVRYKDKHDLDNIGIGRNLSILRNVFERIVFRCASYL